MIIKLLRALAEDTEVFTEGGDCMKLVMLVVSVEQCLWEGNEATQEHCRLVTQRTFVTRVTTPPSHHTTTITTPANSQLFRTSHISWAEFFSDSSYLSCWLLVVVDTSDSNEPKQT